MVNDIAEKLIVNNEDFHLHDSSLGYCRIDVILNVSTNKITFNFVPREPIVKQYLEEYISKLSKEEDRFILLNDEVSIQTHISNVAKSLSNFISMKMQNSNTKPLLNIDKEKEKNQLIVKHSKVNDKKPINQRRKRLTKRAAKRENKNDTPIIQKASSLPVENIVTPDKNEEIKKDNDKRKQKLNNNLLSNPSDCLLERKAYFEQNLINNNACALQKDFLSNEIYNNKNRRLIQEDKQVYFVVLSHNAKKKINEEPIRITPLPQQTEVNVKIEPNEENKPIKIDKNKSKEDVLVKNKIETSIKEIEAKQMQMPVVKSVPRSHHCYNNFYQDLSAINFCQRPKKSHHHHHHNKNKVDFLTQQQQSINNGHVKRKKVKKANDSKLAVTQPARRELSFTQLNLAPVTSIYKMSATNLYSQHSLLKGELSPIPEHKDKSERHKKCHNKNHNRINDKKTSISELVTKREKSKVKNSFKHFLDCVNKKKLYNTKKKVSTDRLIEIATKVIDDDGSTKIGFTVEGIEPPKRIMLRDKTDKNSLLNEAEFEEKMRNLHMTYFPIIEVIPLKDNLCGNSDTQTTATESQIFNEYQNISISKTVENKTQKKEPIITKDNLPSKTNQVNEKIKQITPSVKADKDKDKDKDKEFIVQLANRFENVHDKIMDALTLSKIGKPNVKYKVPKKSIKKNAKTKVIDVLYDAKQKYKKESEEKLTQRKIEEIEREKNNTRSNTTVGKSSIKKKSKIPRLKTLHYKEESKSKSKMKEKPKEELLNSKKLTTNVKKQKSKSIINSCGMESPYSYKRMNKSGKDSSKRSNTSSAGSVINLCRTTYNKKTLNVACTNKKNEPKTQITPHKVDQDHSPKAKYFLKKFLESIGEDNRVNSNRLEISINRVLQEEYKNSNLSKKTLATVVAKSKSSVQVALPKMSVCSSASTTATSADNISIIDRNTLDSNSQNSNSRSVFSSCNYLKNRDLYKNSKHHYVVRKPQGSELISLQVPRKFEFTGSYGPKETIVQAVQHNTYTYDRRTLGYMHRNAPGINSYGNLACYFCKKLICCCKKEQLIGDEDEKYQTDNSTKPEKQYPTIPTIIKPVDKKNVQTCLINPIFPHDKELLNSFPLNRRNVYQTFVVLTEHRKGKIPCSAPQSRAAIISKISIDSDAPKSTSLTTLSREEVKERPHYKNNKFPDTSSSETDIDFYKRKRIKSRKRANTPDASKLNEKKCDGENEVQIIQKKKFTCDAECQSVCDVACQSTNSCSLIVKRNQQSMVTIASFKPTKLQVQSFNTIEKSSFDVIESPFFLHKKPKMLENLGISCSKLEDTQNNNKAEDFSTDSLNSLKQQQIEHNLTSFHCLSERPITNFLVYNNTIQANNPFAVNYKKKEDKEDAPCAVNKNKEDIPCAINYRKKEDTSCVFNYGNKNKEIMPYSFNYRNREDMPCGLFNYKKKEDIPCTSTSSRQTYFSEESGYESTNTQHSIKKNVFELFKRTKKPLENNTLQQASTSNQKNHFSQFKTEARKRMLKHIIMKSDEKFNNKKQNYCDLNSEPEEKQVSLLQKIYSDKKKRREKRELNYDDKQQHFVDNINVEDTHWMNKKRAICDNLIAKQNLNLNQQKNDEDKEDDTEEVEISMTNFKILHENKLSLCGSNSNVNINLQENDDKFKLDNYDVDKNKLVYNNYESEMYVRLDDDISKDELLKEAVNLKVYSNLSFSNLRSMFGSNVSGKIYGKKGQKDKKVNKSTKRKNSSAVSNRQASLSSNRDKTLSRITDNGVVQSNTKNLNESDEYYTQNNETSDENSNLMSTFTPSRNVSTLKKNYPSSKYGSFFYGNKSKSKQQVKEVDSIFENANYKESESNFWPLSKFRNFFGRQTSPPPQSTPKNAVIIHKNNSHLDEYQSDYYTTNDVTPVNNAQVVPEDQDQDEDQDQNQNEQNPPTITFALDVQNADAGGSCKCEKMPAIRDYRQQTENCKAYYEKIRLEEEAKKQGYWRQYTEFTEIPLYILLGKKVPRKKPEFVESAIQAEVKRASEQKSVQEPVQEESLEESVNIYVDKREEEKEKEDQKPSTEEKSVEEIVEEETKIEEQEIIATEIQSQSESLSDDEIANMLKGPSESDYASASSVNENENKDKDKDKDKFVLDKEPETIQPEVVDLEEYYKDKVFVHTIIDDLLDKVGKAIKPQSDNEEVEVVEIPITGNEERVQKFQEAKEGLTDREVFDKLLNNYEKEDSVAERLSVDKEFFEEQLSHVKSKKSAEDILQKLPAIEEEFDPQKQLVSKDKIDKLGEDINTDNNLYEVVDPAEIGHCFTRGFRTDNIALSGDACFAINKQDKIKATKLNMETESIIDFSERDTPLDFLLALGFMVDEATNALKDEDVEHRLLAAITEARVWINQITTTQGTLLYLVALKAKPRTMRYFLQLVEAIINKRITNAVKLDGFLRTLEKIEDGEIGMINIFGLTQFEDEDNEEKVVKNQLREVFISVYKVAEKEANKKGMTLDVNALLLLRILAARYRAGLHPHLELIASYIGKGLLITDIQLEAAMIFLSRLDTVDVKIKEFEKYCGIGLVSNVPVPEQKLHKKT